MTAGVCPYCRGPLLAEEPVTECEGCGTRHHSECYEENGGCTIFGCSKAPIDEPKLTISAPDLAAAVHSGQAGTGVAVALEPAVAPPPPPPGVVLPTPATTASAPSSIEDLQRISSRVVPSMFSLFGPEPSSAPVTSDPEPEPLGEPKSRTTFIVLGAVLGPLGAHNFYAGYTKKAIWQLAITVLTLGFGSPMTWVWAIIDICTVNRDNQGIEFAS